MVAEGPGMKGSCKDIEVCHHEEGPGEAFGGSTAQMQKTPVFWSC